MHDENLTPLSAMKRLKANADKMLWITYITVFERMAAYCLHDKETCASRHSSVESERRDAGFENKKSFQKKCQSISRLFLFLKNHLIYRQIEIACNCKSIRKVSGKYQESIIHLSVERIRTIRLRHCQERNVLIVCRKRHPETGFSAWARPPGHKMPAAWARHARNLFTDSGNGKTGGLYNHDKCWPLFCIQFPDTF